MIAHTGVVLDANILLRAALGKRVRHILKKYEELGSALLMSPFEMRGNTSSRFPSSGR
ncbi:MAG TPA: hypothetical protein VE377_07745 [Candidatus Dormibacteraeota bacterium]|nr:hypothetical protein [Candidatus Dormibacteraeota bacterium]